MIERLGRNYCNHLNKGVRKSKNRKGDLKQDYIGWERFVQGQEQKAICSMKGTAGKPKDEHKALTKEGTSQPNDRE